MDPELFYRLSAINMSYIEFTEKIAEALNKDDYSSVYFELKKFFDKLEMLEAPDGEYEKILSFLAGIFEKLVETNTEKGSTVRNFFRKYIDKIFDNTHTETEDNGSSTGTGMGGRYSVKNEFMRRKIAELFADKSRLLLDLLIEEGFGAKMDIVSLLIQIYDRFPNIALGHFPRIFSAFLDEKRYIPLYKHLMDKIVDLNPKNISGFLVSWLDKIREVLFDKENLPYVDVIFELIRVYCEIYPDYFGFHFFKLMDIFLDAAEKTKRLRNNPLIERISENFAFVFYFYAKRGVIVIAEYTINILSVIPKLSTEARRLLLLGLHELYSEYPEEVSEIIVKGDADRKILSGLLKIMTKSPPELQDTIIDLYLFIIRKTFEIRYNSIMESPALVKIHNIEFLMYAVKNYTKAVRTLLKKVKNPEYLFFKTLNEIDEILRDAEKMGLIDKTFRPGRSFLQSLDLQSESGDFTELLLDFIDDLENRLKSGI